MGLKIWVCKLSEKVTSNENAITSEGEQLFPMIKYHSWLLHFWGGSLHNNVIIFIVDMLTDLTVLS